LLHVSGRYATKSHPILIYDTIGNVNERKRLLETVINVTIDELTMMNILDKRVFLIEFNKSLCAESELIKVYYTFR